MKMTKAGSCLLETLKVCIIYRQYFNCLTIHPPNGPRQANLVLIAYASSEGSGETAQSRQNLRCWLIQAVRQEEPSDRKPDPWPL